MVFKKYALLRGTIVYGRDRLTISASDYFRNDNLTSNFKCWLFDDWFKEWIRNIWLVLNYKLLVWTSELEKKMKVFFYRKHGAFWNCNKIISLCLVKHQHCATVEEEYAMPWSQIFDRTLTYLCTVVLRQDQTSWQKVCSRSIFDLSIVRLIHKQSLDFTKCNHSTLTDLALRQFIDSDVTKHYTYFDIIDNRKLYQFASKNKRDQMKRSACAMFYIRSPIAINFQHFFCILIAIGLRI